MAGSEPTFLVVVNDEEQYSVWPAGRPLPAGWTDVGITGSRPYCLARIRERWVDMRPRSVRDRPPRRGDDPSAHDATSELKHST